MRAAIDARSGDDGLGSPSAPLVPSLSLGALFTRSVRLGTSGVSDASGGDKSDRSDSPPDSGALSERSQRQRKLSRYEGELSTVLPFLALSGAASASDRAALAAAGITHVLNCARIVCANTFERQAVDGGSEDANAHEPPLSYMSLWLLDTPSGTAAGCRRHRHRRRHARRRSPYRLATAARHCLRCARLQPPSLPPRRPHPSVSRTHRVPRPADDRAPCLPPRARRGRDVGAI